MTACTFDEIPFRRIVKKGSFNRIVQLVSKVDKSLEEYRDCFIFSRRFICCSCQSIAFQKWPRLCFLNYKHEGNVFFSFLCFIIFILETTRALFLGESQWPGAELQNPADQENQKLMMKTYAHLRTYIRHKGNTDCFTWRHGSHFGFVKQWNGGHLGVQINPVGVKFFSRVNTFLSSKKIVWRLAKVNFGKLALPRPHPNCLKRSFSCGGDVLWNSLTENIREIKTRLRLGNLRSKLIAYMSHRIVTRQ